MVTLADLARRIGQDMKARSLVGHRHTWGDVDGKPTSFPPAAHTHPITDVDGLQDALPRTTAWESLGTLTGLTAGTCRFRWANGQPQLAFASVEWEAGATIPWTALPAEARIDGYARSSAVLTATTDLTQQATIIAYSGFIYMGQLASPQPMTGMVTWTI